MTLINSDTIRGGMNGDGVTQADAVQFRSGGNTLELHSSSQIEGNVVATAAGSDKLRLGGTTDDGSSDTGGIGAQAQYRNFTEFEKAGSSSWTLTGTTTEETPWTVKQGTLTISDDASLGAASGRLTLDGGTLQATADIAATRGVTIGGAGGTVLVDDTKTLAWSGGVSGAVQLAKTGDGVLQLTGDATHTGGTTVGAGTLEIGNGGATGSLAGNVAIADNATLAFNRNNPLTVAGVISGDGAVAQRGTGITTLTGANTYTGGTTIQAGTLAPGNGGKLAATGAVDLAGAGATFDISASGANQTIGAFSGVAGTGVKLGTRALTFGDAADQTFAGSASGKGGLVKQGAGTQTFTGANTYTGGTTINAGTLALGAGGSLAATGLVTILLTAVVSRHAEEMCRISVRRMGWQPAARRKLADAAKLWII